VAAQGSPHFWLRAKSNAANYARQTVWFTEEAIAAWAAEPRTTRGDQPWYSPLAILTALTLRAMFRLAFRQTEGLIGSIIGLLGLRLRVPDHTTLRACLSQAFQWVMLLP
jgi:Transposase DDE domain